MFEYRNLDWDTSTDAGVDPVVINTWYTALTPTRNVKAYYLIIKQTNTGATIENIEAELIIDGIVTTDVRDFTSGVEYYTRFSNTYDFDIKYNIPTQLLALDLDQSAPLETRSLGIRVRQTTAVDITSAIIEVNMVYATLEAT